MQSVGVFYFLLCIESLWNRDQDRPIPQDKQMRYNAAQPTLELLSLNEVNENVGRQKIIKPQEQLFHKNYWSLEANIPWDDYTI